MKRLLLLLSIPIALIACTNRNTGNAIDAEQKLNILLTQKDYFKLEKQFKESKESLSNEKLLFFKAFIDNAFNRNLDCVQAVNQLLTKHASELPDSAKATLYRLLDDSYFKLFEYDKAAGAIGILLKKYSRYLSKDEVDDIKNNFTIRNALKNVPAQQTILKNNTTIRWTRNSIGLMEVPMACHTSKFGAVFDTRANISTISKTYAEKLGLRMLKVSYNEGSSATGIRFKTSMGVADSINIGNITVKNVLFQVMPDSILYIAPVKFQLNIIIGFPVIAQLQEIHLFKDGKIIITSNPSSKPLHNLALDGLDPLIALKTGGDTLPYLFDSGATGTVLYKAYFDKFKKQVLKTAVKKTVGFGGAGGSQKKSVYILPKSSFTLVSKAISLDNLSVLQQKITPQEKFYGNIGQDFIRQFNEITLNFKYMYMEGK